MDHQINISKSTCIVTVTNVMKTPGQDLQVKWLKIGLKQHNYAQTM